MLHGFWKDIVRLGVVTRTRKIGRAELYKLNTGNPLVKQIIALDNSISRTLLQEELKRQKPEIPA